MKKYLTIFICLLVIASFVGCSNSQTEEQKEIGSDERVLEAIEIISARWSEVYEESKLNIEDKHLEIINTKIINIKPNNDSKFEGLDYIVEFSLESNYFNSAPYYSNIGSRYSLVAVYTNGKREILTTNPFQLYINQNGPTDFQDIIESVENFHGEYDQILKLK